MKDTAVPPKGPPDKGWSARSVGSHFQHHFFYLLIRYGRRRAAYAFLVPVVLCYALFSTSARRKALHYLSRRFGNRPVLRQLPHIYRLYFNLGKALIDRAATGILGENEITMKFHDSPALEDLLREGHGLLLMTAHVGWWFAAMSALKYFSVPVNVLLHRDEADIDRLYFEHGGRESPFRIIDPMGYLGGVLQMMEVLKKGEVLSVMGDRLLGSAKGSVSVDFLGGKVPFPSGSFRIASATGAPVAVLFSHESGPGEYTLEVAGVIRVPEGAGGRGGDLSPYVGRFVKLLESYVHAHPYQFFNFYDMWQART